MGTVWLLPGLLDLADDVKLPHEIHSNVVIDRATTTEFDELAAAYDRLISGPSAPNSRHSEAQAHFAIDWSVLETAQPGLTGLGSNRYLDPDEHRCFVLRSTREFTALGAFPAIGSALHAVACLREPWLNPLLGYDGVGRYPLGPYQFFGPPIRKAHVEPVRTLTGARLALFAADAERHEALDRAEHAHLLTAIRMFNDAMRIEDQNPLHGLGLFCAIEAALTVTPNTPVRDETGQERRHPGTKAQLTMRLPLLFDKIGEAEALSPSGISSKSFIDKLYGYRSAIAHGDPPRKEVGGAPIPPQLLSITQDVLCCALHEPQWVTALRQLVEPPPAAA